MTAPAPHRSTRPSRTPRARPTPRCSRRPSATTSTRRSRAFGDREALVDVRAGRAVDVRGVRHRGRPARPRAARRRRRPRATGSASGRRTAPSGSWSSTRPRRSARSWSTSTRPTAPTSSSYVLNQAGIADLVAARVVQDQRLRGDARRGARRAARRCGGVVLIGTRSWDALLARADDGRPPSSWREVQAALDRTTRSTSSTPRAPPASPRARPSATATSSTTATSSASCAATPRPTGSASPCPSTTASAWSWATSRAPPTAPHGHPGAGVRPGRDAAGAARTSAAPRCTACPRCSSPSGRCPTSRPTTCPSVRTGIMAGSPCPAEMMKQAHRRPASTEMTICYGMTETSPVSTQNRTDDTFEQKVGTVGRVGPHLEIKVVDPVTGETLPRGRGGRVLHQGLLGDARLLGAAGQDRRGARRRLDAHRRHRGDGRRRLRRRSPAASRTWSSAAARTSTRARSRSSSTPTPTSSTPRSSASPTRGTARSCAPGSG